MAKQNESRAAAYDLSANFNGKGVQPVTEMYTSWLECMGKVNHELFNFMNQRLQQDFEMPTRLAECHSPSEFYEMQAKFIEKLATDYTGEAQKISKLIADVPNSPKAGSGARR